MHVRVKLLVILCVAALFAGCSKPQLTKDKAQELLEASKDFQPQKVMVTLTPDELKTGIDAGYWVILEMNKTNFQLPHMQVLNLTQLGASYFRTAAAMSLIQVNQPLASKVVDIKEIQDVPGNDKEKIVTYTWIPKFEYALPEVTELFKDQGPRDGKKSFVYGKNGWELKP